MKQKTMIGLVLTAVLTGCGSGSNNQANENSMTPIAKPVTWENILGKWEIQGEEMLTQKNLGGKIIEFVQDSIFYYDADGNSVHRFLEFDKTYGPVIETVKDNEIGTAKVSNPVSMNFHEMDAGKLILTEEGQTIPMKKVNQEI